MKIAQFETIDGETINLEFITEYGFGEFVEKYWFVEEKLKDRGYELVIRGLQGSANDE